MFQRAVFLPLFVIGILLSLGSAATAQVTGVLQAVAVVSSSLTVQGTSQLDFQTVVPGVDKAVDKATAEAGEFTVAGGGPGAEVQLTFTLPNQLLSGANSMPVVFSTTDASYATDVLRTQSPPTAICNPYIVTTANLAADGGMTVWIGGEVMPSPVQSAGTYSANIELTVTLTGN